MRAEGRVPSVARHSVLNVTRMNTGDKLTARNRAVLERPTVGQRSVVPEGSLPCTQLPATVLRPRPDASNSRTHLCPLRSSLIQS